MWVGRRGREREREGTEGMGYSRWKVRKVIFYFKYGNYLKVFRQGIWF